MPKPQRIPQMQYIGDLPKSNTPWRVWLCGDVIYLANKEHEPIKLVRMPSGDYAYRGVLSSGVTA